jgi:hypothetical protein
VRAWRGTDDGRSVARAHTLREAIETETVHEIVLDMDQTIRARYERLPSIVAVHAEATGVPDATRMAIAN